MHACMHACKKTLENFRKPRKPHKTKKTLKSETLPLGGGWGGPPSPEPPRIYIISRRASFGVFQTNGVQGFWGQKKGIGPELEVQKNRETHFGGFLDVPVTK